MASSQIRVNAIVGISDTLIIGSTPTFDNVDDTGALSHVWQLVSKPEGSLVTLTTPTAASTLISALDKEGSYKVRLVVNGTLVDEVYVAVRTAHLGLRPIAGLETLEDDAFTGWANDLNNDLIRLEKGIRLRTSITVKCTAPFTGPGVGYVTGTDTLPNGDIVYTVSPASATVLAQTRNLVWLNSSALLNAVIEGTVIGLTAPVVNTGASSLGAPVYLSNTAGGVAFVPGTVERAIGYVVVVNALGRIKFSSESDSTQHATVAPPPTNGTGGVVGVSARLANEDHAHLHGNIPLGAGLWHALVTPAPGGIPGFMDPVDKAIMDAQTYNTAIYDPGAILTTAPNIFITFAAAVTYLNQSAGLRALYVLGSGTVPLGAYNLTDIELIGALSGAQLTVLSGASFIGLRKIHGNLLLLHGGQTVAISDFVTGDNMFIGPHVVISEVNTGEGVAVVEFMRVPINQRVTFSLGGSFDNTAARIEVVRVMGPSIGLLSIIVESYANKVGTTNPVIGPNTICVEAGAFCEVHDMTGYNRVSLTQVNPITLKTLFFTPWATRVVNNIDAFLSIDDYYVSFINLTAPVSATLPQGITVPPGTPFIIKDESGLAATHNITVQPDGAELLDGLNSGVVINAPYGALSLIRRNGNWWTT